jgi:hypothetical protein
MYTEVTEHTRTISKTTLLTLQEILPVVISDNVFLASILFFIYGFCS